MEQMLFLKVSKHHRRKKDVSISCIYCSENLIFIFKFFEVLLNEILSQT